MKNILPQNTLFFSFIISVLVMILVISAGCSDSGDSADERPARWGQAHWGENTWNK